jgi:xanthine dehydrogenase accessory factor
MKFERNKNSVWDLVKYYLDQNSLCTLMIVVDTEGSTPGQKGFKMLITQDGELAGSIGGGLMEYNLVEFCKKKMAEHDFSIVLKTQVHDSEAPVHASGMICSGTQKILILPLNESNRETINGILELEKNNEKGILKISPDNFEVVKGIHNKNSFVFSEENETDWIYEENLDKSEVIYIFGGGHVGLALSRIMKTLTFYIILVDNRPGIDTIQRNKYADEKIIIEYDKVNEILKEGENVYVVIMTSGHSADELVLKQVIRKNIKYLGMMGSPVKVQRLFYNLLENGFTNEELKKVHSPIGLPVHSRTPEEIAISIAAEIIQIKNT